MPSSLQTGYQVLGVQAGSPASDAGLVNFLDIIQACNSVQLLEQSSLLTRMLAANVRATIVLTVYNTKSQSCREVPVVPQRDWCGPGSGLIGCQIRFGSFEPSRESAIHLTHCYERGPAAAAGLVNDGSDYLLGTQHKVFASVADLGETLRESRGTSVALYVYSSRDDTVRLVHVVLGGDSSALGGEVAQGLLHNLPEQCCETEGINADADASFVEATADDASASFVGMPIISLKTSQPIISLKTNAAAAAEVLAPPTVPER